MSTTGWTVSTSVVSQPSSRSAAAASAARSAARPSPSSTKQRTRLVDGREIAVQQLLGLVRLGRDERALAELQRRLLRRRPVAAGARDHEALVARHRLALARAPRRPRPAARRRPPRGSAAIAATAHV